MLLILFLCEFGRVRNGQKSDVKFIPQTGTCNESILIENSTIVALPHPTLFSLRGPKIINRLYIIYRLARKYFFHMKRLPLPVMGCTMVAFAPSLWLLKREGSFS